MELNLSRLPFCDGFARSDSAVWMRGTLYMQPIRLLSERGALDVRDLRMLAHMLRRFVDRGCPADRRVGFTLAEAARWAGYDGHGGRQVRLVRDGLMRMRATTIESTVRYPDGHTESLAWGLVDRAWTTDSVNRAGGFATLSEELAELVRRGSLTYLQAPMLDALSDADPLAARLWVALESETIPTRGWHFAVFSATEGQPPTPREMPALADLLRISDWRLRRRVAFRIAAAARVIGQLDQRYTLDLARSRRDRGQWVLTVSRMAGERVRPGTAAGTGRNNPGYSGERDRAQNRPHRRALPSVSNRRVSRRNAVDESDREDVRALLERWPAVSPAQVEILDEVAGRHDVTGFEWAAEIIRATPSGEDPLAAVMIADRADQAKRRRQADEGEAQSRARIAGRSSRTTQGLEPLFKPEATNGAAWEARRQAALAGILSGEINGVLAERAQHDYDLAADLEAFWAGTP